MLDDVGKKFEVKYSNKTTVVVVCTSGIYFTKIPSSAELEVDASLVYNRNREKRLIKEKCDTSIINEPRSTNKCI